MTSLVKTAPQSRALAKKVPATPSDHDSFHRTVARAAVGGAGGALIADLIARALSLSVGFSPLFLIAAFTGAIALVGASRKKTRDLVTASGLGVLGGSLFTLAAAWPPFAALLLGGAAAPVLAKKTSIKRKAVTAVVTGVLATAGFYVGQVVLSNGLLAGLLPGPVAAATAGAAVGLFIGLASAPKHLARRRDPVDVRYLQALTIRDGELHEILSRALSIYQGVRADLAHRTEEDPTIGQLGGSVSDHTLRILDIVEQCRAVESDLASLPGYEMDERIAALENKAKSATDATARQSYERAIADLDEQRQASTAIRRGRERVIARLHANVALLEKVRFSLIRLKSADTERFGGEGSPVSMALEELGREVDVTSSAVVEVFGKTAETFASQDLMLDSPEAAPAPQPVLDERDTLPPS